MYLSNIKLWNFRIFGTDAPFDIAQPTASIDFKETLNVLIGENDSGKTAIIDAIKLVLKTHSSEWIKLEQDDFYKNSRRLRIECTFKGLSTQEARNFTEWLQFDGQGAAAKPYLTLKLDASRNDDRILPWDVKAGADVNGHLLTAEAKDKLRIAYLRPLRDAKSELAPRRNSRLSQILFSHEAFADKTGHRLVQLADVLNKEIAAYFKGKKADESDLPVEEQQGKALKDVIDGYLGQFAGRKSNFNMTSADLKSILESLSLLFEDGYNLGLGSHNLLCIASELLHLKNSNWDGLRLGLVEEIEAHLHPQVQLQVMETLKTKAKGVQLIFTTHSPNIGSKVPLENLIICNCGRAYPMGPTHTHLEGDDYKFLEIFLDVTKANLFFAKGIILVEGWAEEILIPAIAAGIGINLTEKGVSIINVGSTAYLRYSEIFRRRSNPKMEVPVSVVTDVDIRTYTKELVVGGDGTPTKTDGKNTYEYQKREDAEVKAEATAKIAAIDKSVDNIQYFITTTWTLEYALFLSNGLTDTFKAAAKKIHSRTNWDNNFERALAKKLIEKTLDKTAIAYEMANAIYEDIKKANTGEQERQISINADDENEAIANLIKAIKHAARV